VDDNGDPCRISLGWIRCHFDSGNIKQSSRVARPRTPVLSHCRFAESVLTCVSCSENITYKEASPADMGGHWTRNNGADLEKLARVDRCSISWRKTNHERAKVEHKIECVILPTIVKEKYVGNDSRR
jgi:hypothetical protein